MLANLIRRQLESARHELSRHVFEQMVQPVMRAVVRHSGISSDKGSVR